MTDKMDWNLSRKMFQVYWGDLYLGWTDTEQHARGIIRRHIAARQARGGQRDTAATMRKEYSIRPLVEEAGR